MRKQGVEGTPSSQQSSFEVGQDWPDAHYEPDQTLIGRMSHEWISRQYQPRFARYYKAYSNLEKYESSTLRTRVAEAIEIVAKARKSIAKATNQYLADFKYDGLIPSGYEQGQRFFSEEIAFLENTIQFCCFVVSSVNLELKKRKEPVGAISVAEGIQAYEKRVEEEQAAVDLEYRTRDNGSAI